MIDAVAAIDAVARELMLFAAAGLLLGGLDDLAVDLLFLVRSARRVGRGDRRVDELPRNTGRRMAVVVAAWQEAAVIGPMLSAALDRYVYDDYLVFVAAYPNDRETTDAIARVAERDARVRLVMNPRPGPTTKADNLNAAWAAVEREERASGRAFAGLLIHDAEDLVHPDELAVCAALIGGADVVQLPVVPLVHPRAPLVSGHYADEFAESHGKHMIVRTAIGAGMPLAGTGCAIRRDMLARIAAERGGVPFDPTSLVEDYELGLAVAARGGTGVFARYRSASGDLVAVSAYFPCDFAAAARQKARWMAGIALAGWDRTGWARPLALADHWMRARDRRAPLAVLVLAAAYGALLATSADAALQYWMGRDMAAVAPAWLLVANAGLLLWRLAVRIAFTARAYGARQAAWAIPRFLVGNLVALAAGPRALATYGRMLLGTPPAWDKTEHEIPDIAGGAAAT